MPTIGDEEKDLLDSPHLKLSKQDKKDIEDLMKRSLIEAEGEIKDLVNRIKNNPPKPPKDCKDLYLKVIKERDEITGDGCKQIGYTIHGKEPPP